METGRWERNLQLHPADSRKRKRRTVKWKRYVGGEAKEAVVWVPVLLP